MRSATNSMPVYLQGVRCGGRELSILECGFRKHLTKRIHGRDVAVQCTKCKSVDQSIAIPYATISMSVKAQCLLFC